MQSNRANTTPCTPGVNLFELPQGCVSLQHHHVQPVKGIYLRKSVVLVGRATRITQSKMFWDLTGWSSLGEIIELCWLSPGCILTWLRTQIHSDLESCKTWICLKTGYLVWAPKWQLEVEKNRRLLLRYLQRTSACGSVILIIYGGHSF